MVVFGAGGTQMPVWRLTVRPANRPSTASRGLRRWPPQDAKEFHITEGATHQQFGAIEGSSPV
jgi:hypothetical protein